MICGVFGQKQNRRCSILIYILVGIVKKIYFEAVCTHIINRDQAKLMRKNQIQVRFQRSDSNSKLSTTSDSSDSISTAICKYVYLLFQQMKCYLKAKRVTS